MIEQSPAKHQGISPLSILTVVFASLSFSMIFFSPFGPFDSSFIPFHPMGWAGMFVFLAMLCWYGHNYQQTKDNFWFILALMFLPVLVSDLYFFPIPEISGFGMAGWMGVQLLVCFVCFTVASEVKVIKYSHTAMLLLFPSAVVMYIFPQSALSIPLLSLSIIFLIVIAATLSYYAFLRKEYFLVFGAILNFVVSMPIPNMYIISGFIPFGWNQPLMAVVTDRIAIFGRILMVLSLPMMQEFMQRFKLSR